MKPNHTMLVVQVVMTCLVTALGLIALADGRVLVGVLLVRAGVCPRRHDRATSSSAGRVRPPIPRHGCPESRVGDGSENRLRTFAAAAFRP